MGMKMQVELRLTRALHAGSLSLREIKVFTGGKKATGHFADQEAHLTTQYGFQWGKQRAMRALTALLLRHFAPDETGAVLRGGNASLAMSLHEVARKAGENWFKKLWVGCPNVKSTLPLPEDLFDSVGNTHEKAYSVRLGAGWAGAELKVWLEKKEVPALDFLGLAEELDPLHGALRVEVRKAGTTDWRPAAEVCAFRSCRTGVLIPVGHRSDPVGHFSERSDASVLS